jgi:hypothetical protein
MGLGEFNGLDYLAAARTADGGCVIAYMPLVLDSSDKKLGAPGQ